MKIYLASRYTRRRELVIYADDLRMLNHQVMSSWLTGEHEALDNGHTISATEEQIQEWAVADWVDLVSSDCIIAFTEPPRSEFSRGGRHVEWGAALSRGIRCICIGHRENVFYSLPQVEFYADWPSAVRALTAESKGPL